MKVSEALKQARDIFGAKIYYDTLSEYNEAMTVVDSLDAALPLAVLMEQAVEAWRIFQTFDMVEWLKYAVELGIEIPKEISCVGDLKWSGDHGEDARYTYPARQKLWKAIADALLQQIEQEGK